MLDVADVLQDPDLAQTLTVRRAVVAVDDNGRAAETPSTLTISGVVAPATDEQLQRLAEGDRSSETIAVYTATRLTDGDDTHGPDVVAWKGGTYLVKSVWDWSDYGYFEALAQSDTMQGKDVSV
jgi:hypothetical protein